MAAHGQRMSIAMNSSEKYLIESNKGFRHRAKRKEQILNEDLLERFACMVCCDCSRRFSGKTHREFQEAYSEWLEILAD